jgi:endonuclease YncB( thermonuclease family)
MGKTRDNNRLQPTLHRAMPVWANGHRNPLPRRRRRMRRSTWILAVVGLGLLAAYVTLPDAPFSLEGPPLTGSVERVVDGDTLDIAGQRVRLPGLDAPEWNQTCKTAAGDSWACGAATAKRMRELTRGRTITCRPEGHDRYGRLLAICRDGATDLAEVLVADGLAVTTGRYASAEALARRARRGLWAGSFDSPAEWRRREAGGGAAESGNPSRFDRFLAWLWGLLAS